MDFLKRLWKEEEGQGLVEYGLLVLLVVGVVIIAINLFDTQIQTIFTNITNRITTAIGATEPAQ